MSLLIVASTTQPGSTILVRSDNLATLQTYDASRSHPKKHCSTLSGTYILTVFQERAKKMSHAKISSPLTKGDCVLPSRMTCIDAVGTYVFGGTDDGMVIGWNSNTGSKLFEHQMHMGPISLITADEKNWILYAGSSSGRVGAWSIPQLFKDSDPIKIWPLHTMAVTDIVISSTGNRIYTASEDRTLKCIDVTTLSELISFPMRGAVTSCCVSNNGSCLFAGTIDGALRQIDLTSEGSDGGEFVGHTMAITDIKISPDDRALYTISLDQTIRKWDISTKQTVQHIPLKFVPVSLMWVENIQTNERPRPFVRLQSSITKNYDDSVSIPVEQGTVDDDDELLIAVGELEENTVTQEQPQCVIGEEDEVARLRRENGLLFQKILELQGNK